MITLLFRCFCLLLRTPLQHLFLLTKMGSRLSAGEAREGSVALGAVTTSRILGSSGLFISSVQTSWHRCLTLPTVVNVQTQISTACTQRKGAACLIDKGTQREYEQVDHAFFNEVKLPALYPSAHIRQGSLDSPLLINLLGRMNASVFPPCHLLELFLFFPLVSTGADCLKKATSGVSGISVTLKKMLCTQKSNATTLS